MCVAQVEGGFVSGAGEPGTPFCEDTFVRPRRQSLCLQHRPAGLLEVGSRKGRRDVRNCLH